ncbi:MAG: SapC family protein [Rhodobacteraceae bacterium]|nr:SapC family protein [Paracoccaceae bacterium]MBR9819624.1 SapC family protein [Paracoccaceae bacterium]
MTKQLLIYDKVVPVNRQTHRDLSVRRTTSFAFAQTLNSVPIVDVEFAKVALEAPIVFAKTETGPVSLALIGVEEGRCALVNDEGAWTGRYVPAFLRRYPFVFSAQQGNDKLTLCVDESFEGLNTENRGERLFDADGKETTYLSTVLRFIEEYQATFNRTQAFCDRLAELDLLEEARIDYRLGDGKTGGITGFWRVSNEKLRALPDDKIAQLFRSGDLDLIQLHMLSMHNAERLIAQALGGAPAPTASPAEAEEAEPAEI